MSGEGVHALGGKIKIRFKSDQVKMKSLGGQGTARGENLYKGWWILRVGRRIDKQRGEEKRYSSQFLFFQFYSS